MPWFKEMFEGSTIYSSIHKHAKCTTCVVTSLGESVRGGGGRAGAGESVPEFCTCESSSISFGFLYEQARWKTSFTTLGLTICRRFSTWHGELPMTFIGALFSFSRLS
eukprot:768566-Hanusia_phi.AAC.3